MNQINKEKVANSFSKASGYYSQNATMQFNIALNLLDVLFSNIEVDENLKAIDIGCGPGFIAEIMQGKMEFFQTDISEEMCQQASKFGNAEICDMHNLSALKTAKSFNLATCSMALQWSEDLLKVFNEVNNILAENGVFAFSLPSEKSLSNLRKPFNELGKTSSINKFPSDQYLMNLAKLSNFKLVDFKKSEIKVEFEDIFSLLKSFKQTGANISLAGSEKLTKSNLKYIEENYYKENNKLILDWEINYVILQK